MKIGTPFKPQLLVDTTIEQMLYRNDSVLVEPKIDGIRGIIHKDGNEVKIFTRSGKDYTDKFTELMPVIQNSIRADKVVLDGELAVFKNNKPTSSNFVMRKQRKASEILTFCVFDILQVDDTPLYEQALLVRKETLKTITPNKQLFLVPFKETNNKEEIQKFYKTILRVGFEGIVLKDIYAPYIFGRSFEWGRMKPVKKQINKIKSI